MASIYGSAISGSNYFLSKVATALLIRSTVGSTDEGWTPQMPMNMKTKSECTRCHPPKMLCSQLFARPMHGNCRLLIFNQFFFNFSNHFHLTTYLFRNACWFQPAVCGLELNIFKGHLDAFTCQGVEEILAVGVGRVVLWISWREQTTGFCPPWTAKVVGTRCVEPPRTSVDLELSWKTNISICHTTAIRCNEICSK